MFFITPPVVVEPAASLPRGHSVRYLAEKARRADLLEQKRKERDERKQADERSAKKAKIETIQKVTADMGKMKCTALALLERQLAVSVAGELTDHDLDLLRAAQKAELPRKRAREENEKMRTAMRSIKLGSDFFADDWDSRLVS